MEVVVLDELDGWMNTETKQLVNYALIFGLALLDAPLVKGFSFWDVVELDLLEQFSC